MELSSVIVFFVIIVISVYGFLYHQFTYWKRRNIPYIKPNWIFGNVKDVEKTIHHTKFWIDAYQKLKHKGPVGGIFVFFNPIAIITDLNLIRQILIKDFHIFPDRAHYFDKKNDPISAHLVNIEGSYWKFIRNKLSPAFSTGKLKAMFQPLADLTDNFLEVADNLSKNGKTVDMRDLSVRFVSDALGLIGFGIECNSMTTNDSEFHKIAVDTMASITYLKKTFLECNREFFKLLRVSTVSQATRKFYTKIVNELLEFRTKNNIQRNDILSLMVNSKDNSRELKREEIIPQLGVFLAAGHETTVTVMSHCIYELSLNEDLQIKARESIHNVLKEFDGKFCYEAIQKMDYIEQCIFETARKYFISFSVRRMAVQDYKVPNSNIVIEKGTIIQIPVFAINNDPDIYPEPEKWDPDRYSVDEIEKRHKFAFLTFGDGPRLCIGKRLSITILKIVLAKFLMTYSFTLDTNKTSVPIKHCLKKLFLTPTEGIHVKLNKLL